MELPKLQYLAEASATPSEKPWDGSDIATKKLTYDQMKKELAKVPILMKNREGGAMFTIQKGVKYTSTQFDRLIKNLNKAVTDGTRVIKFSLPREPKAIFVDWDEEHYPTRATVMYDQPNSKEIGYPAASEEMKRQKADAREKAKSTKSDQGFFLDKAPLNYDWAVAKIEEGPYKGALMAFNANGARDLKKGDTVYLEYGSTYGSVRYRGKTR